MTKDEQIEAILTMIHNMIDVEDVKPQLEELYKAGYMQGCEDTENELLAE